MCISLKSVKEHWHVDKRHFNKFLKSLLMDDSLVTRENGIDMTADSLRGCLHVEDPMEGGS